MNIQALEESNILSISMDQTHLFFEMNASLQDGTHCKLRAWNDDGVKLTVRLGALNLDARADLGELEAISLVDNVLILEGDFGDIEIEATNVVVETIQKTLHRG